MKSKQFSLTLFLLYLLSSSLFALPTKINTNQQHPQYFNFLSKAQINSTSDLLEFTPKKYYEITGEKMRFKDKIVLKAIQFKVDRLDLENTSLPPLEGSDLDLVILLIIAILIPPLAIFLKEGMSGSFWLNILILLGAAIIGFLPLIGFISYLLWLLAIVHAIFVIMT